MLYIRAIQRTALERAGGMFACGRETSKVRWNEYAGTGSKHSGRRVWLWTTQNFLSYTYCPIGVNGTTYNLGFPKLSYASRLKQLLTFAREVCPFHIVYIIAHSMEITLCLPSNITESGWRCFLLIFLAKQNQIYVDYMVIYGPQHDDIQYQKIVRKLQFWRR